MAKPLFVIKKWNVTFVLLFFMALIAQEAAGQVAVPFTARELAPGETSIRVKGDIELIGNSIIKGKGSTYDLPYNGGTNNNNVDAEYIDIDGDSSTFSSSSAGLNTNITCKQIIYAGLYWASAYPNGVGAGTGSSFGGTPREDDWNKIKFKLPTGGYIDLEATGDEIILDGLTADYITEEGPIKDGPIVCYKNVTSLLQGLTDADGTYTVGNLRATQGKRNGGCAGGWTLVVIYESPDLPSKFISTFDGYAVVQSSQADIDINISGFQTLPNGLPVNAKIGVASLEGDLGLGGDTFQFKASSNSNFTPLFDALNPNNNFFNSRITREGVYMTDRNPNSENSLGFDIKNIILPNNGNAVLPNDETAGTLKLTTSGDGIGPFLTTFAVDIIEPKVVLTKAVQNAAGDDIGGGVVDLGDELKYVISIENIGNDDAQGLTIRDALPINIDFNYPGDIDFVTPGITHTYDAATKEMVFTIPDHLVTKKEGPTDIDISEIIFSVKVVQSCNELSDACSNIIRNQAFATYRGVTNNTYEITEEPSYEFNESNNCILAPQATNFLADIDHCTFEEDVILCGESTEITAPDGYDSYLWSTDPNFNDSSQNLGTGQSLDITSTGTYYVRNTAIAPCQSTNKQFEVTYFGGLVGNPVAPYADEVVECGNDGSQLPNFYLCGLNDVRNIQTSLTNYESIIWEKLDETSCNAVTQENCANTDSACQWNFLSAGPNFDLKESGEYRLTIEYEGGCFNQFYFNSYTNLLNPDIVTQDIICNTKGNITVNNIPSGYEFSFDGGAYSEENSYEVSTPGIHNVKIKQEGVDVNPCVFEYNVTIDEFEPQLEVTSFNTTCYGDVNGRIKLSVNGGNNNKYRYEITEGGSNKGDSNWVADKTFEFSDLTPGTYDIKVSLEDGCIFTDTVDIIAPDDLLLSTSSSPITCENGIVSITASGGVPDYSFVDLSEPHNIQDTGLFEVDTPGIYNYRVTDANGCTADVTVDVKQIAPPTFTVAGTDLACYGDVSAQIEFDVTNANGYAIEYSIDNGASYASNAIFPNLSVGTYTTRIKYSLNGVECLSPVTDVIIDGPDDALTASAGVSELAGCGTNGEGTVRITNPQGGEPPYEYSFDNQSSWTLSNSAEVLPGTYTLYIRDSAGCIFTMTDIVLDQEPEAPVIDDDINPEYNCDGTANATVNVTNNGGSNFDYTYLLDGVENPNTTDPTTFLNVPDGNHTITVQYELLDVPTFSNLLLETFGSGDDTQSPGINTAFYCFEYQQAPPYCKGQQNIQDGDYSVTAHIESPYGDWSQPGDHTSNNVDVKGRSLVVNIGDQLPEDDVLYKKTINDIIPNQPINFELFVYNLMQSHTTKYDPNLTIALVDGLGNEISSFATGNVPKSEQWEIYPKTPITLNPGNNTTLEFLVRSTVRQTNGNDVAIDDIRVYQLPKSCIDEVEFPIVIEAEKAFNADVVSVADVTCHGASDGIITISATNFDTTNGYQYSIDNGTTWNTVTTSPFDIENLDDNGGTPYNVQIRYDATSSGCEVSIPQTISTPAEIVLNIDATPITCISNSTITATTTGGTAPYTYDLIDINTASTIDSQTNGIFTNVLEGDYTVRVTDANSCTSDSADINLSGATAPTASLVNVNYCYDATNGATLEVSASNGQPGYQYSINGSPFASDNTFNNLTPGTYTITVRDANGCEVTLPVETIEPQVHVQIQLDKVLDCSPAPDARISVNITDGYPSYEYSYSDDNGLTYSTPTSTGNSFAYLTDQPGTYIFRVTDDNDCEAFSNAVIINPISNPTATTVDVKPSCNGNANGSYEIVASGGQAPYQYSVDGGTTFTSNTSYTGLADGIYNYIVRDALGCDFSGSVTLTAPTALVATASATTLSCDSSNAEQAAVVTIDLPTTGTAPYTYSFNAGTSYSNTNTLSVYDDGTVQTINYSVKDANGCVASDSLDINPLDSPTDLDFVASDITCKPGETSSEVTITSTGGVGTLVYEILNPASATTNVTGRDTGIFTGLDSGTYVFKVTDDNGCSYTEAYTVGNVTPIALIARKDSDVLCFGDATGAIELEVSGFSSSYNYTINGGSVISGETSTVVPLGTLTAGTYTFVVEDETTGCTDSASITIGGPTSALTIDSATGTNVFCTDDTSKITVVASGGTPNYGYAAVVNGATAPTTFGTNDVVTVDTNSNANLVWDVYVEDQNGCVEFTTVTLTADPTPTVSIPSLPTNQCSATTGFTFDATATGTAPLTYSIDGGATYQSSPTFTINTPGTYTVRVKDANGCTSDSGDVNIYTPLTGSASLVKDITCELGNEDAIIGLSVSDGNPNTTAPYYSYEVSTDAGSTYTDITGSITAASEYSTGTPGTYQFRYTDANGCQFETAGITVNATTPPVIDSVSNIQTINCNGEETASIEINHSSGFGTVVYNVYNDTESRDYGTQTSGLDAGVYTITITDDKGCIDTLTHTISEPDPIDFNLTKVDITCDATVGTGGTTLGSISVENVTGGTESFEYYITNNFGDVIAGNPYGATAREDHTFTIINYGIYTVNVVDSNGCSLSKQITMASPPSDLVIDVTSFTSDCSSGGTAVVEVVSTVGSGSYEFAILESNIPPYSSSYSPSDIGTPTIKTFDNLVPGRTYTFVVYDTVTTCYYVKNADTAIAPASSMTSTVEPHHVTCKGESDGSVTFTLDGYDSSTSSVDYQIFDATNNAVAGATGGNVSVSGTPVTVTIPNPGTLSPGGYHIVFTENGTGSFDGCKSASAVFDIFESAIELDLTASSTRNENCNELGVISAVAQNGTAPYEYMVLDQSATAPDASTPGWDGASTYERSAGIYTVYVKDAYGCIKEEDVTVTKDAEPTINNVAQQCFDGNSFDITLSGTTFDTNATYAIGTGGVAGAYTTNDTFSITAAGTYDLFIKDANGCVASTTYVVETPLVLDAVITKELDCTTNPDAEITLTPSGGVSPSSYSYEVNYNGLGYSSILGTPYAATAPGTYQFRITNDQTCIAVSTVVTVDPIVYPVIDSAIASEVSCIGESDASIVVTASSGVPPYTYSIDNGLNFQGSNVFDNLPAGTYDVVVMDSKSCQSTPATQVVIADPTAVVASAVVTDGLVCGPGNVKQNALVTVSGTGGTGTYSYSFDGVNYSSTNTYNTNLSGTVNYWVKDSNGCIDVNSIVIDDITPPSDMDFTQSTVTCIVPSSIVTITSVTHGVAPYTYEILAPTGAIISNGTNNVFTGLAPDTYAFRVTDANGCYYDESFTVDPAVDINVTGTVDTDVACFGGNQGSATFTVSNVPASSSYTAILTTGAGTIATSGNTVNLTGLIAGNYTIEITDDTTGCTDTADFAITEPTDLTIDNVSATNVHCNNYFSQLTVTALGGTPSYSYAAVVTGGTPSASDYSLNGDVITVDTNNGTNLVWDVYVKDANDICIEMTTVTVDEYEAPSVTVDANAVCSISENGFEFTATNTTDLALGFGPFEYSIGTGYQSSPTFSGLTPGDYTVTIKDGNGCTADSGIITVHPAIDVKLDVVSLPTCGNNDGEILVTGSGGSGLANYSYTINPSIGTSPTVTGFTGLAASTTYTVTILDGITGCEKDATITLEAPTPVTFTTTSTETSCNGGMDGTITVDLPATNDNPIYTYTLDDGVNTPISQTSNVFYGLAEGTYNITVTSERGCELTSPQYVGQPDQIVVPDPAVVQYACNVGTNTSNYATITVAETAITGGSGNYTIFEFYRNNALVQRSTSNIYTETDLLGGTYYVMVYDDKSCEGRSIDVDINPFISIEDLTVNVNDAITCTTLEEITVSVTPNGGTPNLEYTVVEIESDGTPVFGGYSESNTTGVFAGAEGLHIANYLVTVENTDTNCILRKYHYVSDPNTFDLTIDNVVNITCFGANDGAVNVEFIDLTPTDDSGPFSYEVTDALGTVVSNGTTLNSGPETLFGLESGTYTITATLDNRPNCEVSKAFTINGPTTALAALATHTDITCDLANGTITASATGGWPGGYEYQLEKVGGASTAFSSTFTFLGLDAGEYNVNVKDSSGCIATTTVQLDDPSPILFTATPDMIVLNCFGDSNATINVTNTIGGQGSNYTYVLNKIAPVASQTGPQTTTSFTGLSAGTYNVTVRDGWNCSTTSTNIIIDEPSTILSDLVIASTQTCLTKTSLTLSATGGTGAYEYSDDPNFATISGSFTTSITFDVDPGTYQYYIRDANNCASGVSNRLRIDPLPLLSVDIDVTNAIINCYGDNTGVIVAKAQGGLGNYTYTLQDASGTDITPVVQNNPGVFTELVAGDYQVYVTSGDCVITSRQVSISQPAAPLTVQHFEIDVACSGGDDGSIEISATGGTGIIKYAISPRLNQFFDSGIFENLTVGVYQAVIQDESGCFEIIDFTIGEPTPVILTEIPTSVIPEVCSGDLDGAFSIDINGGSLPYSVTLDDINGNYTTGTATQTQFDFDGLEGGNHTVFVVDAQGCESEWEINFPGSINLDPHVAVEYDCINNASTNRVVVTVDDSIQDLSQVEYSLNGGPYQSSNIFTDVPGGVDQFVDVKHANGCIKQTRLFDVDHITQLEVILEDGVLNQIVVTVSGGVEPYEYSLNGGAFSSTDKFLIYESGDYTVTVRDFYGCEASATRYFEFIDVCIPNYFTPNDDGVLDGWGPGCTIQYKDLTVQVFDRYGRKLATLAVNETWDGTYNGEELPSGDYWYVINLNDPLYDKDYVGHFTLYR
ncbi:T9SS type B sorting domain-containing protein [Tamlana sp. 2_MG-2023]|uniref:T9SS type B sorting domain-containing protein n=1 Tax=unclassified Tamlana TaxID=2614803 RepID=UPI0026E15648|nr:MULTISPECIES: T9SS type B sorting domain-containing protein [unclassified Tamlana]MDO6761547.1 T9SS type B sorting domain-containing protein [Tamlana sp. 2_MG-2023]MDO6792323.1 T9SS type B sorting domain-containing protein [Tamlana sp. 1_MG-2023]